MSLLFPVLYVTTAPPSSWNVLPQITFRRNKRVFRLDFDKRQGGSNVPATQRLPLVKLMMKLWLWWKNTKWCLVKNRDGNGNWTSVNIDRASLGSLLICIHGNGLPHPDSGSVPLIVNMLHISKKPTKKPPQSETVAFWKACCLGDGFGEPRSVLRSSLSGDLSAPPKRSAGNVLMGKGTVDGFPGFCCLTMAPAPSSQTLFKSFASVCTKLQIRLSTKAYV